MSPCILVNVDGATDDRAGIGAGAVVAGGSRVNGSRCYAPGYFVGSAAGELLGLHLGLVEVVRVLSDCPRNLQQATTVRVRMDSQYVHGVVSSGRLPKSKEGRKLMPLLLVVRTALLALTKKVSRVVLCWVPRGENSRADAQAGEALAEGSALGWEVHSNCDLTILDALSSTGRLSRWVH
jgi:ribonuclease HI